MRVIWQMVYRDVWWLGSLKVEQNPEEYDTVLLETTEPSATLKQTKMVRLLCTITNFFLSFVRGRWMYVSCRQSYDTIRDAILTCSGKLAA